MLDADADRHCGPAVSILVDKDAKGLGVEAGDISGRPDRDAEMSRKGAGVEGVGRPEPKKSPLLERRVLTPLLEAAVKHGQERPPVSSAAMSARCAARIMLARACAVFGESNWSFLK